MIKSSIQLKAKVRNISKGDDKVAQAIIRLYFMERFLERVSLSKYKDQFVLKGWMLISSLLGINLRATMDIDTTVKALPLTKEDVQRIITEISEIPLEDNIIFQVTGVDTIMEDFDYPGIRVHLEGLLEKLRQPVKIDVSTDDVITPSAVEYKYPLIFEKREISLNTYNVETLLAEKSQTIINRGLANTRMRDFYDLYEIVQRMNFSWETYKAAFQATCKRRETIFTREKVEKELENLSSSKEMEKSWISFKSKNYFVDDIEYANLIRCIFQTIMKIYE